MKVIHLISGGDTGGAKTHVLSLLKGLNDTEGVTADMVCFVEGPFAREAREMGIPTTVLPGICLPKTFRTLKRMIKDGGYQVIHCHGARSNMTGVYLRAATGLPTVSTIHSDYRLDYMGRPLSRLTYGMVNTVSLRLLDYRIGVSDAMTDLLASRGFDPNKLFTIYNGIDFTPRTPALPRREYLDSLGLDWDNGCVIAGIAARLNPVKDIPTLIRGFALAHKQCPELRLIIAGEGEQHSELECLARELGVEKEVCFAGWVTDTDSFYNALDINTLTSLSETFSYALTEGARMSLPTVSSRVGGVPYLIDHGVNGLLFEAGDYKTLGRHLTFLAKDPDSRKRLGESLREKGSRQFSLESTIERQISIYESILRRRARRDAGEREGVLICGAYGQGNAGDQAILKSITASLRELDPDMTVTVLSRSQDRIAVELRVKVLHTFNMPAFHREMRRRALFLDGGGNLIQDVTSRRSLWYYLYTLRAAKKRGCKVMMYGCGIGPVNYPSDVKLVRKVLNRYVDAITLRESMSRSELEHFGVTAPEIAVSADPALSLAPASDTRVDSLMSKNGLDPQGRYICFSVRDWEGFDRKAPVFAAAADYCAELGCTPLFVHINSREDAAAAKRVRSLMSNSSLLVDELGDVPLTIGFLSRMSAVVSMRLHGLIFAASTGTPVVGVSYDPKVTAFLDFVGEDLCVPFESVTVPELCAMIDRAVSKNTGSQARARVMERLRAAEKLNIACAERLLKEAGAL